MKEYVHQCEFTPDNPIILVHWNWDLLFDFVRYINPVFNDFINNLPASAINFRTGTAQCARRTVVGDISAYIQQQIGPQRFHQNVPVSGLVLRCLNGCQVAEIGFILCRISLDPMV